MIHDSRLWKVLGWAFGVVGPIVCFAADPGFFRRTQSLVPAMNRASLGVYLLAAICTATLASVLLAAATGPIRRGVLLAGGVVASLFALVLLPIAALAALTLAQGLHSGDRFPAEAWLFPLGWVPLGTALVFWRAFAKAPSRADHGRFLVPIAALVAIALPIAAQMQASHWTDRAVRRVAATPTNLRERDVRLLHALAFTADLDPLVRAWMSSPESEDKQALADTYATLAGGEIRQAAVALGD
jgi:hypothetical protein